MLKFHISEGLQDIYYALEKEKFKLIVDVKFEDRLDLNSPGNVFCRGMWKYVSYLKFEILEKENKFYVSFSGIDAYYSLSDRGLTAKEVIETLTSQPLPDLASEMMKVHPEYIVS